MFIVLIDNPEEGFTVLGPFETEQVAETARQKACRGHNEWGKRYAAIEPLLEPCADRCGTAVCLREEANEWIGPFADFAAAQAWAEENGDNLTHAVEIG